MSNSTHALKKLQPDIDSGIHLRKPRTFGDVTPVLVHDLKGPLSAIMMNVDFALDQLGPEGMESARAALSDARQAGDRLFRMIANVLDIARAEDGSLHPARAPLSFSNMVKPILLATRTEAEMRGLTLEADVPQGLAPIDSDPDVLSRVLMNLVENALRYANARGRVCLRAETTERDLVVRVCNDGPEVPPHVVTLLRSTGHARPPGRGLGLYFCRLAMEALGGSIGLEAEPPPGYSVSFVVTHPLSLR